MEFGSIRRGYDHHEQFPPGKWGVKLSRILQLHLSLLPITGQPSLLAAAPSGSPKGLYWQHRVVTADRL
jgi:hypothetical protein